MPISGLRRPISSSGTVLLLLIIVAAPAQGCDDLPDTAIKSIPENATIGTIIPIIPENATFLPTEEFFVTQTSPTPFPFEFLTNNTLNVTTSLDRERVPSYLMEITCKRSNVKIKTMLVVIKLTDIDDTSPVWVAPGYYSTSINEGNKADIDLAFTGQRPQITDADEYASQSFRISILPTNYSSYLQVVNPTTTTPSFRVRRTLDFETINAFNVTLQFEDLDLTGRVMFNGTAILTVNINDVEDEPPKFSATMYWTVLRANATRGRVLNLLPGPLNASDGDTEIRATVNYALLTTSIVDINTTSGQLTLNQDNPKPNMYYAFVKAFEVANKRESIAQVQINVTADALLPVCSNSGPTINVPEDFAPGQDITSVLVSYPDQSQISYAVQTFTDMFNMSGSSLILLKALDFENRTEYDVNIRVNSHTETSVCVYRIRVTDVNDHVPQFVSSSYTFTSAVRQGFGVVVGTVQATDGDAGSTIVYSISSSVTTFSVDPTTGNVKINTTQQLTETTYSFLVVATDDGTPSAKKGQVLVTVNVDVTASVASANTMVIALATLGGLLVFVLIVAAIIFFLYRKRVLVLEAELQRLNETPKQYVDAKSSQKPSQTLTENQKDQTANRYYYENQAGTEVAPAWTNMPSPLEAMYKEYCTKDPATPDGGPQGSAGDDDEAPCVNLGTEFSTGPGSIRSVVSARSKTGAASRQRIVPTPVVDSPVVLSEVEGSIESYSINHETPPPTAVNSPQPRLDNAIRFI